MKKSVADAIKAEVKSVPDNDLYLQYMSKEEVERLLSNLSVFQLLFDIEITDYALDCHHDLFDSDEEGIVRAYWFSKGMEDHFICLSGDGEIESLSDEFPYDLLSQISILMDSLEESE